ncbi:hypothetical protein [Pedobacter sp. NJ-S-72]
MKSIILTAAALLAITGISTVKAAEIKAPLAITMRMDSTQKVQQDSTQKVPVKLEELPAPVITTLKAEMLTKTGKLQKHSLQLRLTNRNTTLLT